MGSMTTDELDAAMRAALADFAAVTREDAAAVDARPAAVLVPVLSAAPEARLVFTVRTQDLSRHAGEVSFPGGLADPGESLPRTALREAEEELGLAPVDVELVGALPAVHTHVSGILIAPFVGLLREDPRFRPNAAEIAHVVEVPLRTLIEVRETRWFERDGFRFPTPVFEVDEHVIWGATGRILETFLDALDASPAWSASARDA
jgi:8-oxo-dGTP pyrophosphatase MutT (NUDIX family)